MVLCNAPIIMVMERGQVRIYQNNNGWQQMETTLWRAKGFPVSQSVLQMAAIGAEMMAMEMKAVSGLQNNNGSWVQMETTLMEKPQVTIRFFSVFLQMAL